MAVKVVIKIHAIKKDFTGFLSTRSILLAMDFNPGLQLANKTLFYMYAALFFLSLPVSHSQITQSSSAQNRQGEKEKGCIHVEESFIRIHVLLGVEGVEHSVLFGMNDKDISAPHSFSICNLLKEERSGVDLEKNKPELWEMRMCSAGVVGRLRRLMLKGQTSGFGLSNFEKNDIASF